MSLSSTLPLLPKALKLLPKALAVSVLLTIGWAARGADNSGRDEESSATAGSTKTEAAEKDGHAEKSLREQDIYIPYEKLRQVFERHGRGVFLPYEEFEDLWRAAQEKNRPVGQAQPPVGAVITEIENEATVAKDVVRVKATLKIDLLVEGWHEIPLRLADAAITSATLHGEPAPRSSARPGEDYKLLVEKKGKAARADRARLGICQGDQQNARPEQRVVPGPASPGEPLARADSAGGRESEPVSADCRHRSAGRPRCRPGAVPGTLQPTRKLR